MHCSMGAAGDVIPLGSWLFSFLQIEEFPSLVEHAVATLAIAPENTAAQEVIAYTSLQCLAALHPYRAALFERSVNRNIPYGIWRGAGPKAVQFLQSYYENEDQPDSIRLAAWRAALETRDTDTLKLAMESSPRSALQTDLTYYLWEVGYEATEGCLRQLYPRSTFHLRFDDDYPNESRGDHPTWHLPQSDDTPAMLFGGWLSKEESATRCAICGGRLHHMLTLDPVPEGLGVTGLNRLTLAVCLSCVEETLFYLHDTSDSLLRIRTLMADRPL
jgi:hypothetical protein